MECSVSISNGLAGSRVELAVAIACECFPCYGSLVRRYRSRQSDNSSSRGHRRFASSKNDVPSSASAGSRPRDERIPNVHDLIAEIWIFSVHLRLSKAPGF